MVLAQYYLKTFGWDEELYGEATDESIADVVLEFIEGEDVDVGQPEIRNYIEADV